MVIRTDTRTTSAAKNWAHRAVMIGIFAWLMVARSAWAFELYLSEQQSPIKLTVQQISQAQQSIDAVVYKFTNKAVFKALSAAIVRGVNVRLIVDAEEADKKKSHVAAIDAQGASVLRWPKGKLHAKFAIFDQRRALAGSFNWTKNAGAGNTEILLLFDNPQRVAQFNIVFEGMRKP